MLKYEQPTGTLFDPTGKVIAVGYSGNGLGLNNHAVEHVAKVGPLPAGDTAGSGKWLMTDFSGTAHYEDKGPAVIHLTPLPDDAGSIEWAARYLDGVKENPLDEGMLVHGDNAQLNFSASEGCMIMKLSARLRMWAEEDKTVQVVPMMSPVL
jgi:hypothetical protein